MAFWMNDVVFAEGYRTADFSFFAYGVGAGHVGVSVVGRVAVGGDDREILGWFQTTLLVGMVDKFAVWLV